MVRKFNKILMTLLLVAFNTKALTVSGSLEQKYPSESINGIGENIVSLSKNARWTGNKNEAIVDIIFSGLENVKEEVVPTDVVFVVDTSRSMVEAGGVVNPDHTFHLMQPKYTGLTIPKEYYSQLDTVLSDYLSYSDSEYPDEGKITIPKFVDWKNDNGFKFFIDPQLRIKLPHDLVQGMWPNYDNLENEDIYLVAQIYSTETDSERRLDFTNLKNNRESEVWFAVDFDKKITADSNDSKNDFPGNNYLGFVPSMIYQKDSKGKRYVESVERVNWYGDAGVYYNYAWIPLYYSDEQNPDSIQLMDLEGNDAVYDANGVPKSWYKSTKDSNGKRVGEYQRAHLLYDSIEYFVKSLSQRNIGDRFAFASFNTKANALDTNGKVVKSQQLLNFTESHSDFLDQLEVAISHSGEERYQKDIFGNLLTTQGTNYQSGMLASREILENDTKIDGETRNKIYIFFSDGQPNYIMDLPNPSGSSFGAIINVNHAGGIDQADFVHKLFSKEILKGKFSNYNVFGVGLQENDEKNIKERFSKFVEDENIFILDAMNNENMEESLKKIFKDVYDQSIETTKLVSIEDVIDNRYFKVDREKLAAEIQVYYPSDYSSYDIEDIFIDGIKHEKVTFKFEINDMTILEQKVSIPLLKLEEANEDKYDGFIPTNYDSDASKGAKSDYIGLDGLANTVETEKVWLATHNLVINKVSSGQGNATLSGAEFELYYHNSDIRYNDTTYVSDVNGKINIGLLPPGKYKLVETKAPINHILLEKEVVIDLLPNIVATTHTIEIMNELEDMPEPSTNLSSLVVSKEVIDPENKGELNQFEFTFTAVSDKAFVFEVNGNEIGVISNGGKFILGHGDVALIKDIEMGTSFGINETETLQYTSNFENNMFEGIIDEETIIVDFVNTYIDDSEPEVPTDPEESEKPEEPGEVEVPENPEESEKPEEPGEVEVPQKPQSPSENEGDFEHNQPKPEFPIDTDNDKNEGALPNTGVKPYNNRLAYTLLITGVFVMVISARKKRKNK